MDFIVVNFTEIKFQTGMRFSREQNLPEAKLLSADRLHIALNVHVRLKYGSHFDRNKILFCVIKYHVNTTRTEMSTYVPQNIRWFLNTAKMKRHVNRTCFNAGLKSQTGMN